ncbi:MAG: hypothetical protein K9N51_12325, partial [Candidatus Pacebacteria bacterium]|nr:hypothetical protein [Candidatus Paceibacterota bacterium]
MKNLKLLTLAVFFLSGTVWAGPVKHLPSEWLDVQRTVWRDNGWTLHWPFPEVLVATHPTSGEREYVLCLADDSPMTRVQWRGEAITGRSYGPPRKPFQRLAFGAMLYASDPETIDKIFGEMKGLGLNSVVLCTYISPQDWHEVEASAERHDMDMIIQYHAAYFLPQRGRRYYEEKALPKAMSMLGECHDSERLLGFAVKEEPYVPLMPWLQEYHAELKKKYPDVPLYVCYNSTGAMAATREPPVDVMGTDIYPFLGGYFGGGRQKPTFLTPQTALRGQLPRYLGQRSEEALSRRAVFTYTPTVFGTNQVRSEESMKKGNIPRRDFPGVIPLENGHYILWRRYAPPRNAMRASVWLSAAYGAQGWFPWYYAAKAENASVPELPTDPYRYDWSLEGANQSPVWLEYAETAKELRTFEDILLRIRPDGFPRFETDDRLLVGKTFRIVPDAAGHVVILANLDVGRWEGYPHVDLNKQNLDVDKRGILTGYEPLHEPRRVQFCLRVRADETVRDLRTDKILEAAGPAEGSLQTFTIELPPGGGTL